MRALFLDDIRRPPEGWELVRTAQDFAIVVKREPTFDIMSLDHDLGETSRTGYGRPPSLDGTWVADWLVRNMEKMPKRVFIHSSNPVGAERMFKILEPHTRVFRVSYTNLMEGVGNGPE